MRHLSAAALVALATMVVRPGQAADLVVLSAAALRSAAADVPARFAAATGHHVTFVFGTAGGIRDKVIAGETADVVIVPPLQLDQLVKLGLVAADGRIDLAMVRLGAAVGAGAKRPGIATAAEFKQALLDAPSLGFADPASGATSGVYLTKLLLQMGVADAVRGKLKLYPDGAGAMAAVARREIALGLGQISEIKPVASVDLVGPLPDEFQLKTVYAAGLATRSAAPDAARSLLGYLGAPEMAAIFKANGFDPP
jgi:molybdate transport system substrate-binding protein